MPAWLRCDSGMSASLVYVARRFATRASAACATCSAATGSTAFAVFCLFRGLGRLVVLHLV